MKRDSRLRHRRCWSSKTRTSRISQEGRNEAGGGGIAKSATGRECAARPLALINRVRCAPARLRSSFDPEIDPRIADASHAASTRASPLCSDFGSDRRFVCARERASSNIRAMDSKHPTRFHRRMGRLIGDSSAFACILSLPLSLSLCLSVFSPRARL